MKHLKQMITGFLAAFMALGSSLAVPVTAAAAGEPYGRPDIGQPTSLEIHYHQQDIDFADVSFRVYKIADMDERVQFSFTEPFSAYPVEFLPEMTASEWSNLAEVLAGYVSRDDLKPDYSGVTGSDGRYQINGLDASLYLVIGGSHQREYSVSEQGESVLHRVYYHMAPFLIATPSLEGSEWIYDVSVSPKFTASEEAVISRRVLKTWDDAGYESQRPGSVLFDLVKDNTVVDTVELTASNSWRHQWDGLDNGHQWRIVEHVSGNYTVTARQEGITYLVSNRYKYPSRPNRPGGGSSGGGSGTTPVPPTHIPENETPKSDGPGTGTQEVQIPEDDVPKAKLPQTGQLWWPVPVLSSIGCMLFLAGWLGRRKTRED